MRIDPIKTTRLVIRRFKAEDMEPFLSFMLDKRSTKYLQFEDEQKTSEGATNLFLYVLAAYDSKEPVHSYAIADRVSGEYLGSCGYSEYEDGVLECYYTINSDHTGNGFASEAVRALAEELSRENEVRAYCDPANIAAHKTALAAGFRAKGISLHRSFGKDFELFIYEGA